MSQKIFYLSILTWFTTALMRTALCRLFNYRWGRNIILIIPPYHIYCPGSKSTSPALRWRCTSNTFHRIEIPCNWNQHQNCLLGNKPCRCMEDPRKLLGLEVTLWDVEVVYDCGSEILRWFYSQILLSGKLGFFNGRCKTLDNFGHLLVQTWGSIQYWWEVSVMFGWR